MGAGLAARDDGFFFFQAEDGIRDDLVTGVQTCALPISEKDDDWFQCAQSSSFSAAASKRVGSPGVPSAATTICICLPTSFSQRSREISSGPCTSRRASPGLLVW